MVKTPRTPLKDRPFPDYTPAEEKLNMYSHVFGVLCAIVMMWLAVDASLRSGSHMALISSSIYVATVFITMLGSSIYHGLPKGIGKQVMRVVDHCNIFLTIAGTYTPITLLGICPINPTMGWSIFAIEWALALIGITLNSIDLKKYSKFSMACYLGMGWCVVISMRDAILAMTWPGFLWIIIGGVAFTIGAVLYSVGKKKRYRHFIFHIFVVIGIITQFIGIWKYLLLPA